MKDELKHELIDEIRDAMSLDIKNRLKDYMQEHKGSGIKIHTPSSLIFRLPILIGQIEAGSNSIDLINEIRKTIYLLYRNNVKSKHIYNRLV